jgi:toxin ParE1/3/4
VQAAFFVAERSGSAELGDRIIQTLLHRCQALANLPHMGRPRPELRPRMRSCLAAPYVIFYRTARTHVVILRIVHERRDLADVFPPVQSG